MWESIFEDRRLDVDRAMMKMALAAARLSNCRKKQNGAIIVIDDFVVAYGFNFTRKECTVCYREGAKAGYWTDFEECPVIHAEVAAIYNASRQGISTRGGLMYCTYFPCVPCARAIGEAGIKSVTYLDEYEGHEPATRVLNSHGIAIRKMWREELDNHNA